MIDDSTQLTTVIGLTVLSGILWQFTPLVSTGQFTAVIILLVGGYISFRAIQDGKLNELKNKVDESNKSSTVGSSELRTIVRKWSDRNFSDNVTIDWGFADKRVKPIFKDGEKDDEYICVTGAKTSSVVLQVFVLASEKKVMENNTVKNRDQYVYPFKYSEYWQEVKRQSKKRIVRESDGNNITINSGGMNTASEVVEEEGEQQS